MIIDDLLKFYKNELTMSSQIYKHNFALKNLCIVLGFSSYIYFWHLFISRENIGYMFAAFGCFMSFLFLNLILNSLTVKKRHSDKYISLITWDIAMFKIEFEKKLSENINNYSDEKLILIQGELEKKSSELKTPYLITLSFITILFTPLWAFYIDKTLSLFDESFIKLSLTSLGFFIFIIFIAFIRFTMFDFKDVIIKNDYYNCKRLNNMISDYRIKNNVG
ncbi:hypothetical protein [Cellulophaga baltica]|uniref:Uncharacterized protein n=1 Tax=Cellulophaga baltica 18 TaxID=1348584 RepID=A0AAU8RIL7_9FLAO|nr:hypothetical protein [Cellulophaga baltica]AIZ42340.1 hypothetical protein M666_12550 [Cellulophaga baltica 18]